LHTFFAKKKLGHFKFSSHSLLTNKPTGMNAKLDTLLAKYSAIKFSGVSRAWRGDRMCAIRYSHFCANVFGISRRGFILAGVLVKSLFACGQRERQLCRLLFCFHLTLAAAAATQVERTIAEHTKSFVLRPSNEPIHGHCIAQQRAARHQCTKDSRETEREHAKRKKNC